MRTSISSMTSPIDTSKFFRHSIIQSLRAASPFSSANVTPSSTPRTESRQTGRDTPESTKEGLGTIFEHVHTANPVLDRSVDLFVVSENSIDQEGVFEQLLSHRNSVYKDHPLFALPVILRRRIYDYCFPDEPRKICLSPRFATKAVFPDGYFASPWDVLEDVLGGLNAFRELRYELMVYFWTNYHFHVTLSQFTGPKFSPLSHIWLHHYLDIVQYLTVEADLTRFGFSALKVAAQFGHDVNKTEDLVVGIVKGLVKRRGKTTMAELNMMCRRYTGFRSYDGADDATFVFEAVPYCPDEALYLCDAICSLRGILQKSRISGFPLEYTEMLLRAIFADGDDEPDYNLARACAWPPVPESTPFENFIHSPNNSSMSPRSPGQFELLLTPTSSFAQDVEDEMLKYESSVYSDKTNKNVHYGSGPQDLHIPRSKTTSTLADQVQKYQECVGSIAGSESSGRVRFSDAGSGRQLLAAPSTNDSPPATPKSSGETNRLNEQTSRIRFSDNESGRHLLADKPIIDSRSSTTRTLNEMNQKNEQDPAFVRSLEEEPKPVKKPRPRSMIPSPIRKKEDVTAGVRSATSQGTYPRPEGTMRRYLSFVKKLRRAE